MSSLAAPRGYSRRMGCCPVDFEQPPHGTLRNLHPWKQHQGTPRSPCVWGKARLSRALSRGQGWARGLLAGGSPSNWPYPVHTGRAALGGLGDYASPAGESRVYTTAPTTHTMVLRVQSGVPTTCTVWCPYYVYSLVSPPECARIGSGFDHLFLTRMSLSRFEPHTVCVEGRVRVTARVRVR